MKAIAKAHTNIALIKYWGKSNDALIIPTNNSLSLTLDGFHTTTQVEFDESLGMDEFTLAGEEATSTQYNRVHEFLNLVRLKYDVGHLYAKVYSENMVPTAAGLASSASGFAALAAASTKALGLDLSIEELSKLTRRGSGSACRSVYGGFVEWQKGELEDGSDSFAVQVAPANYWDVRMAAVVLDTRMKKVSSREGMKRTVDTSVFYKGWLDSLQVDLDGIKDGIREQNFEKVGSIAEANCLKMHATTLGASPPFTYWHDTTLSVIETVQMMRDSGISAYFTIDAGPNVKVLYLPEDEETVQATLKGVAGVTDVILSRSGEGITYL